VSTTSLILTKTDAHNFIVVTINRMKLKTEGLKKKIKPKPRFLPANFSVFTSSTCHFTLACILNHKGLPENNKSTFNNHLLNVIMEQSLMQLNCQLLKC
jgi:hypothetical protein